MIDGSVACRISYGPSGGFYCDYCKEEFKSRHELPCEIDIVSDTETIIPNDDIVWGNPGEVEDQIKEERLKKINKWPRKRKSD
jgi:hypothetical protein